MVSYYLMVIIILSPQGPHGSNKWKQGAILMDRLVLKQLSFTIVSYYLIVIIVLSPLGPRGPIKSKQ
uniref:Uncharacterized protein n=1 Tax=Romanomermis culicivorax TaxID=13658 RepID=A0A915KS48_ROMCU